MSGMPVTDQSVGAGEDVAADIQRVSDSGAVVRITTAATTVAFMGRGTLKALVVEVALTGTVTVYDNNAANGTILFVLPIGFPAGVHRLGVDCAAGCTIVTSAADRVVAITGK